MGHLNDLKMLKRMKRTRKARAIDGDGPFKKPSKKYLTWKRGDTDGSDTRNPVARPSAPSQNTLIVQGWRCPVQRRRPPVAHQGRSKNQVRNIALGF
jgi:hypothetical protein